MNISYGQTTLGVASDSVSIGKQPSKRSHKASTAKLSRKPDSVSQNTNISGQSPDATTASEISSSLESGDFTTAMSLLESLSSEQLSKLSLPDKRSPLHYACQHGRVIIAEHLITKYGYSIGEKDKEGYTPLHIAAQYGHENVIKSLLDMLYATSWSKCENKISKKKVILSNVQYKTCEGNTLLHVASLHGQVNVIYYLVSKIGFSPKEKNCFDQTCFSLAAQFCHSLKNEESLTPSTLTGKNALPFLYLSARNGDLEFLKYLIEKKYRLSKSKNSFGKSLLICTASKRGYYDMVKYLIEQCDCDPSSVDDNGDSPLHYACAYGYTDIVKYLITQFEVDSLLQNGSKMTPLDAAVINGHLDIVLFLVKHSPSIMERFKTVPAHESSGDLDIFSCNCNQTTPLHLAAENGHLEIVKCFTENLKVDPELEDGYKSHHFIMQL